MGALTAALPISTRRTIYLCDDLPGALECVGVVALVRRVRLSGLCDSRSGPQADAVTCISQHGVAPTQQSQLVQLNAVR